MASRLIRPTNLAEGEILMRYFHNRLIRNNKNILGAQLGGTGSGKSYRDLRIAELWYLYQLKKPFPVENICFGVDSAMKRISSGKLKRGELLIFEEAGANLGSLDFQSKVSKMMNYTLQSFRSMNVGILFNLPYLSMLNKSIRMLLHYSMESAGIDQHSKTNKCKPFFHQVNQSSGQIYKKYLRVKINGKARAIKRFNFKMPSDYLVESYEVKKQKFLLDMTQRFSTQLDQEDLEIQKKMARKDLTPTQKRVFDYLHDGLLQKEIAEKEGVSKQMISKIKSTIENKGYSLEKPKKQR